MEVRKGSYPHPPHLPLILSCYDFGMKQKEQLVQVRIYKKEHGVLRRLAFRKNTTIAAVIRQLIKEA
jgi:hypothetical protein